MYKDNGRLGEGKEHSNVKQVPIFCAECNETYMVSNVVFGSTNCPICKSKIDTNKATGKIK